MFSNYDLPSTAHFSPITQYETLLQALETTIQPTDNSIHDNEYHALIVATPTFYELEDMPYGYDLSSTAYFSPIIPYKASPRRSETLMQPTLILLSQMREPSPSKTVRYESDYIPCLDSFYYLEPNKKGFSLWQGFLLCCFCYFLSFWFIYYVR